MTDSRMSLMDRFSPESFEHIQCPDSRPMDLPPGESFDDVALVPGAQARAKIFSHTGRVLRKRFFQPVLEWQDKSALWLAQVTRGKKSIHLSEECEFVC